MLTIADFARQADILAACTVYPWVVTVRYAVGPQITEEHKVILAPLAEPPEPHDMLPEGAVLHRSEVFPATRFDTMSLPSVRARYGAAYKAYRVWRKARAHGMTPAQLLASDLVIPEYWTAAVDRWITQGD